MVVSLCMSLSSKLRRTPWTPSLNNLKCIHSVLCTFRGSTRQTIGLCNLKQLCVVSGPFIWYLYIFSCMNTGKKKCYEPCPQQWPGKPNICWLVMHQRGRAIEWPLSGHMYLAIECPLA